MNFKEQLMRWRMFLAILASLAASLAVQAKENLSKNAQYENLTVDQAIAAIRSKSLRSGTAFHVVREIKSSAETREAAKRSFQEATSSHLNLYNDGIFLDVLRSGGFLVLEVEPNTGSAVWIHLVSRGTSGHTVISSQEIQGSLNSALAVDLIAKNADFVGALVGVRRSPARTLESRFSGGHFPDYVGPSDAGFFGIPSSIRKTKADEGEYQELAALSGTFNLWPIRYAISLSIYPANPSIALGMAHQRHQALVEDFMRRNNKSPDFVYDLQDIESISNVEQLRERISWFKRVNDFLEKALRPDDASPALQANSLISTIALQLGSSATRSGKADLFLVVTSPGLMVEWKQTAEGTFAVTNISLAEEASKPEGLR